jgi:hypothetical protein
MAPETLLLLFLNFSSFHGNGQAVWLGEKGAFAVQLAGQGSRPKQSCVYEHRLAPERLRAVKAQLDGLSLTQSRIKDRTGIPDEVRVTLGYRKAGRWVGLSLWEADLGKHEALLRPLRSLVQELIAAAEKQRPRACAPLARGVRLHQPKGISSTP